MQRLVRIVAGPLALLLVLAAGCTGPQTHMPAEPAAAAGGAAERTQRDLASKGFPAMSRPREAAVGPTAAQSIEDTVKDLGDLYSNGMSTLDMSNVIYSFSDIGYWRQMTHYVKLLRVIEEGRKDPARMSGLLRAEIERSLDSLEGVSQNAHFVEAQIASGEARVELSEKDEFYRTHHSYENALHEYQRRYESTYAAFYALANLGQLKSPDLLAQWIAIERVPLDDCKDMHLWLIHQYFQQSEARGSAAAKRHEALAKGLGLDAGHTTRARWNAGWDSSHPLLEARAVDVSGIPTITILEIPEEIRADEKTKDAIIANFLEHARAAKAGTAK